MRLFILLFIFMVASAGAAQTNKSRPRTATTVKKTSATAKSGTKAQTATGKKATAQKQGVAPGNQYKDIRYTVKGVAKGFADGEWVKLCAPSRDGFAPYDSVQLKDGRFEFGGTGKNIPNLQFVLLGTGSKKNVTELFLEEGTALVEVTAGEKVDRVTGTKHNDIYTPYRDSMNVIYTQLFACISESVRLSNSKEDREAYKAGADLLRNKMVSTSYEFARKNLNNWVGVYLFAEYYKRFTAQQNKALLARLPQKYARLPITAEIRKFVKTQK